MKTDRLAITNDGNNIDPDFEMTTARTYGEWLLRIRRNADDAAALGQRGDALAKAGDYGAAIPFSSGPWRQATPTQQAKISADSSSSAEILRLRALSAVCV